MSDIEKTLLSQLIGRDSVTAEYMILMATRTYSEVIHHLNVLEAAYEHHLDTTGSIDGAEDVRELIKALRDLLLRKENRMIHKLSAGAKDPRIVDLDDLDGDLYTLIPEADPH